MWAGPTSALEELGPEDGSYGLTARTSLPDTQWGGRQTYSAPTGQDTAHCPWSFTLFK